MSMIPIRDVVVLYASVFGLYGLWVGWRRSSWAWIWITAVLAVVQNAAYYLGRG